MKKLKLQLVLLSISIISFSQTRIYSVIGSSTAAGMGTTVPDSNWVNRLTYFYSQTGLYIEPHNLAISGHNCYQGMPSWYTPPSGRDYPQVNENITKALSYNPEVVIVNYPTNNYNYYSVGEIMNCLQMIKDAANAAGKTCYITTSQPRMDANFPDLTSRAKLKVIRDSIMQRFGNYAIDFFTDVTDPVTYQILPLYSYGDGIHLNDRGHALLFEKVKAKNIFNSSPPPPPANCSNIVAASENGGITVNGLSAPVVGVQIFNNSWASVFNQTFTNSPGNISTSTLPEGTYHVNVSFYTGSWSPICNKSQDVVVQSAPPPPPPGNSNCNNITSSAIANGVSFGGLSAPIVGIQIFNSSWISVYSQSYNNSPGTVSVNSLASGTYHTTVSFYTSAWSPVCNKSQDIVVQSGPPPPPGGTPNCNNISMSSTAGGITFGGLIAPIVGIQIFNGNWGSVYSQSYSNSPGTVSVTSLAPGTYHAKATFSTSAYAYICEKMQDVVVTGGGTAMNSGSWSTAETDHSLTRMGMRVLSNPYTSAIRFEINSIRNETGTVIIIDAMGNKVFEKKITMATGNNKFMFDGNRYVPGNYFLRLVTPNGVETVKLIKQ